jgi:hypothetical protein
MLACMIARPLAITGMIFGSVLASRGDEGMWLFTHPPVRQVAEKYGFEITQEWLDHLRKSAVHFGGGSGSFVSREGLILTNHHVGSGVIERLSSAERNLLHDGFLAPDPASEIPCPGMELSVLMSIEDMTEQINGAVAADLNPDEAAAARRAAIATIERESLESTGLRSRVVTLFQGGLYHLYRYRHFTDVRLVFAPDARAAAFGGDPDNFEYPRYCMDYCFFRVYEDGKPAATPDFLTINPAGPAEHELVFVAGHPGRTNRSITLAQVLDLRDHGLPERLAQSLRTEALLRAWADRDRENARRAKGQIIGTQNGRKATAARLNGLLDPKLIRQKADAESMLREKLRADERWHEADRAFDRIAAAVAERRKLANRLEVLEGGFGGLFETARSLLRAGDEAAKPDGERLPEFQKANRKSLELSLFSQRPIYKDLLTVRLAASLTVLCARLGADDSAAVTILAGKSPEVRAAELISGTRLDDLKLRRELYEGGAAAVAASDDPMIALARTIDAEARELRKAAAAIDETITQAHQQIANARFALEGDSTYPDATGSLRLAVGVVKGYDEIGVPIPFQTTFAGLAERYAAQGGVPPFDLSPQWLERASNLDSQAAVNFVSTNDITGGNSGSPVVNRRGELVGLIFDSNAHGLVSDFSYTEVRGRAVCVHPSAIVESLKTIYRADALLSELGL